MRYNLVDLEKKYDLGLNKLVEQVNKEGVRSVLIQLPDGMKPYGPSIVDYLVEKTGALVSIYLGDCFGACDVPESDCDLVVQFGHAEWE